MRALILFMEVVEVDMEVMEVKPVSLVVEVEVDMVKEQMAEILQVEVEDILDMEVIVVEVEAGIIAMEVIVVEVEAVDMEMEEEVVYLLDLVEVVGLNKTEQMVFVLFNTIFNLRGL